MTVDKEKMQAYLYVQLSLDGPQIIHLPEYLKLDEVDKNKPGVITFVDKDLKPIILKGGFLYSHAKTDGIRGQFIKGELILEILKYYHEYLTTHSYIDSWRGLQDSDEGHLRFFLQNLAIHRYNACIEAAKTCLRYS